MFGGGEVVVSEGEVSGGERPTLANPVFAILIWATHFRAPALQTPPKFHERTPRDGRKTEKCGGKREKKAQNFGRSGGGRSRGGRGPAEGPEEWAQEWWALKGGPRR